MGREQILHALIKNMLTCMSNSMTSLQECTNSIKSFSIPENDENWLQIVREDNMQIEIHAKVRYTSYSETYLRSDDEWIRNRYESECIIKLILSKLDIRPPKKSVSDNTTVFGCKVLAYDAAGVSTSLGLAKETYKTIAIFMEKLNGFCHSPSERLYPSRPIGEFLLDYPYAVIYF